MYTTLPAALTAVKTNPATLGLVGAEYDGYLNDLLAISAGKDPMNVTQYRPFLVAARLLEQLRSQQTLAKGDGAEFTGLRKPIESLLGQQAAIDQALALTVPPGYEAILPGCVVCTTGRAPARFGTGSYTSTSRP